MGESEPIAIDLFCGAGGFSTGLQWADYDVSLAIDKDEKVAETYQHNHPDVSFKQSDISRLEPPELDMRTDLDLLVGGPPCPTFSVIGRTMLDSIGGINAREDERHQLWQDFTRYVKQYEPKFFVMENVRGMYTAENEQGQRVLPIIEEGLRDLGYRVESKLLNAVNYGVPQDRERLFIFGNNIGKRNPEMEQWQTNREPKNEREKRFNWRGSDIAEPAQQTILDYNGGTETADSSGQKYTNRRPWVTVGEAILDLPPLSPSGGTSDDPHPPSEARSYQIRALTEYQKWARNIPKNSDWRDQSFHNHEARFHNLDDLSIYKILSNAAGWTIGDLDDDLQPYRADVFEDNYRKESETEPAHTITAHLRKDGHMHIHPTENRSLTVREAARLQSFRDTFNFPVPRTSAYKQVGNAVPPLIAKQIGLEIRQFIEE